MKKYRRKEEVMVWLWNGDLSIIEEIKREIEKFHGRLRIGVTTTNKDILYLSQDIGPGCTGNEYVRPGEYIVFDPNDKNEELFRLSTIDDVNKLYTEI